MSELKLRPPKYPRRRRPLDHLAGGDLIRDVLRQYSYLRHPVALNLSFHCLCCVGNTWRDHNRCIGATVTFESLASASRGIVLIADDPPALPTVWARGFG